MCFTVNVNIIKEELEARYGSTLLDPEKYTPSYYYHAFAYPDLPIAYIGDRGDRELSVSKWGLIPGWVSDSDKASKIRKMTHNARSETINEKPSFSDSFRHRRCLVPVAGFFEWQHHASAKKPWYIFSKKNRILSLGGIHDSWYDKINDIDIHSFSIITTRANPVMAEIHNSKKRMPLIISPEDETEWLEGDIEVVASLLKPFPEERLSYHTVNPILSRQNINKNRPEIIEFYEYPAEPSLF